MEYYRAKTENGLLIQATIWMNFTLSERKHQRTLYMKFKNRQRFSKTVRSQGNG